MTTESETQIKELQKRIINAIETSHDPAPIQKELEAVRAKIAAEAELEELKKIADKRKELRNQAEKLKVKVKQQSEAINNFLKERDSAIELLATILSKVRELPRLQDECCSQFFDAGQLGFIQKLPEGYLPKGLAVPFLEGSDGIGYVNDRAAQAVFSINSGLGLLQSLVRVDRPIPARPPSEFETINIMPETSEEKLNCCVCNHANVAEINTALKNGASLRDIEAQYQSVSRSSLSRHRQHIS